MNDSEAKAFVRIFDLKIATGAATFDECALKFESEMMATVLEIGPKLSHEDAAKLTFALRQIIRTNAVESFTTKLLDYIEKVEKKFNIKKGKALSLEQQATLHYGATFYMHEFLKRNNQLRDEKLDELQAILKNWEQGK